jgi:hypothetical protein
MARKLEHVLLLEYIAHQSGTLARTQPAFVGRRDARGILTAVL